MLQAQQAAMLMAGYAAGAPPGFALPGMPPAPGAPMFRPPPGAPAGLPPPPAVSQQAQAPYQGYPNPGADAGYAQQEQYQYNPNQGY